MAFFFFGRVNSSFLQHYQRVENLSQRRTATVTTVTALTCNKQPSESGKCKAHHPTVLPKMRLWPATLTFVQQPPPEMLQLKRESTQPRSSNKICFLCLNKAATGVDNKQLEMARHIHVPPQLPPGSEHASVTNDGWTVKW